MSRVFVDDDIVVDVYDSERADKRGAVIFCHGLPGGIGPIPSVVFLNHLGFDVVFPQYSGSYDSAGTLSPASAVESVTAAMRACSDQTSRLPSVQLAMGHSFGAWVLGSAIGGLGEHCSISRAMLLAPVLSYSRSPDSGTREDLLAHIDGVRRTRPMTYRCASPAEWADLANGIRRDPSRPPWRGSVLSVVGSADDTFDIDVLGKQHAVLVEELFGSADSEIAIVNNAGHGMDELLDSPLSDRISDFLIDP